MEKGMCNYDGFNTRFFRFDTLEKNLYVPDAPAAAPDAQRPPAPVRKKK